MTETERFQLDAVAGSPVSLPITTGPATGYSWELELPDGVERIEDGPGRDPPDARQLGGSTRAPLRVTAPAGDHVVHARLVRPWQTDRPIRTARIELRVAPGRTPPAAD